MKKLITIACAFAVTLSVNAQDNTPKSGDWSVGTNAAPVLEYVGNLIMGDATSPDVAFGSGTSISGKYFTDDMTAWRGSADLYFTSDSMVDESFRLGLSFGKEMRKGTANLQGYWGYQANVNMDNAGDETNMAFGAGAFLGVEYFVRPKMGIGAEYGYGLSYGDSNVELGGGMGALMLNLYF
ncbi:MAG: hypothetical protein P8K69_03605 [Flavobacteriales bacterium]|nr:hypothetical protein [Flavobacteriales bacterium]